MPHAIRRLGAAAALATMLAAAPAVAAEPDPPAPDQWIVELDSPPAAAYRGGVADLQATSPERTGRPLDPDSRAVRRYEAHLDRRQADALAAARVRVRVDAEYRVAFAGFAAQLGDEEVAALRRAPGVRRVTRERFLQLSATDDPGPIGGSEAAFLGLPGGLWDRLGGPDQAGDGVVVGVLDTGITPEHPSVADRSEIDGKPQYIGTPYEPPALWNGACQGGEAFPSSSCNDKLIGARYFADGIGGEELPAGTFLSPRDDQGHGTHVASTAAGNYGVDPTFGGRDLTVDRISGVAPRARLATYKVCWVFGCSLVDVLAGIDAAVADGVDVMNLSLGGISGVPVEPIEVALLNADEAGVFVAAAAGNFGGLPFGVDSPARSPWTTAVAATTGPRAFHATVTARAGGTRLEVSGPGVGAAVPESPLVDHKAKGPVVPPATAPRVRACVDPPDPGVVRGKIVICERLNDAFAAGELRDAGAVGMIVIEPLGSEAFTGHNVLPTVFVTEEEGAALRRLANDDDGAVASLSAGAAAPAQADRVASFSSRGPQPLAPDVLRPDVAAPGVSVLAGWAPQTFFASYFGLELEGELFASVHGTSMASPHVAGAGALLSQAHPTWSSAAMRSALVTSARETPASPLAAGGGRIDPTAAAEPGLIVEPSADDYRRYAEGLDPEAMPGDLEPLAGRDLNLPSVQIDRATENVELTRTVTSVEQSRSSWVADDDLGEFDFLAVSPARFTLSPGQRQRLTIRLSQRVASAAHRQGAIVLRNQQSGKAVRIPVAAHNPGVQAPLRMRAPAPAADGELPFKAIVSAPIAGDGFGLARPEVRRGTFEPPIDLERFLLRVPEGVQLLSLQGSGVPGIECRFRYDDDGDGEVSGFDGYASELPVEDFARSDVPFPDAGLYWAECIAAVESTASFEVRIWIVTDSTPDDLSPPPSVAVGGEPPAAGSFPGQERELTLRWRGVDGAEPLRGLVEWRAAGGGGRVGVTAVEVVPGASGAKARVEAAPTADARPRPRELPGPAERWRERR